MFVEVYVILGIELRRVASIRITQHNSLEILSNEPEAACNYSLSHWDNCKEEKPGVVPVTLSSPSGFPVVFLENTVTCKRAA